MAELSYDFKVNSARSYLRTKGFLHYGSQLVPNKIESETWSLVWAYIRRVDDLIDNPALSYEQRMKILLEESMVIEDSLNNRFEATPDKPIRHIWLNQFLVNEDRYYNGKARPIIRELYRSALMDVNRIGKLISRREMDLLLYRKAVNFFRLYFTLARFDMGRYLDDIAYNLGKALGSLDDVLDFQTDYESGYINVPKEDAEKLGITPTDKNIIDKLIGSEYLERKAKEIMGYLIKARKLAFRISNTIVRWLVLRLTESFAYPILKGNFVPGGKYFFRGGKLLLSILPRDEGLAYKIGNKLMRIALLIPQINLSLFNSWIG